MFEKVCAVCVSVVVCWIEVRVSTSISLLGAEIRIAAFLRLKTMQISSLDVPKNNYFLIDSFQFNLIKIMIEAAIQKKIRST